MATFENRSRYAVKCWCAMKIDHLNEVLRVQN
jgi:hypothetical protein